MYAVAAIALHDLRRRLRDRSALVMAFVAPFALSAIMGIAFGSGGSTAQVRIAVVDADNSASTRAFLDQVLRSLSLGPGVSIIRLTDVDRGHRLYAEQSVSAAIALMPGSAERIAGNLDPFIKVETSGARPLGEAVAEAFRAAAKLRRSTDAVVSGALSADGASSGDARAGVSAAAAAAPALAIADDTVAREQSPLGYFAPSMAIVFLFLSVGAAANSVLAERATGTMARMQAAPIGMGAVVAGKTLSIVGLMLLSMLSLWGATALAFDAYWGQPAAVVVLCVATVAAISALGLFVTVAARTEATAQVAAAGLAFVLALLGGNFFPPGSLPPLLERLALLTPNGWALDGFTTLSLDGGALGDVVRPVIVLAVIAAVAGSAAVLRFQRAVAPA